MDDLTRAARELEQQRSNERLRVVNELKQANDAIENARELMRQARTDVPAALVEERDHLVEACRQYEKAAKQTARDARKEAEKVWSKAELQQLGLVSTRAQRAKDSDNESTEGTNNADSEPASKGAFMESASEHV